MIFSIMYRVVDKTRLKDQIDPERKKSSINISQQLKKVSMSSSISYTCNEMKL